MAKKGFFGKLIDATRNLLKHTFGDNKGKNQTSRQAEDYELREAKRRKSERVAREAERQKSERVAREAKERKAKEEASRQAAREAEDSRQTAREAEAIQNMKDRLEPLISEANRRAELLQAQGYASAALSRAEQETGRDYFTLDNANTRGEIIKEATRARVFLADETSTIEGAKIYTAQLNAAEFRGKFGNQYHTWEHKFKNFDTSVINEEIAKTVFSNYRKLEELRAADITGDGAYGSENLIIAMYEAQVRGEDSFMVGLDQLDAHYRKKTIEWQSRFERANEVGSILGTITDYGDGIGGLYF